MIRRFPLPVVAAMVSALVVSTAYSVDAYESPLSENAVCINFSPDEVAYAKADRHNANALGVEAARQVLLLAGMPESISGKVASLPAAVTLSVRYGKDLWRVSKGAKPNSYLTLKYYNVNIEGLRRLWELSGIADEFIPSSGPGKEILNAINKLANATMELNR